jgi:hypothetical protein
MIVVRRLYSAEFANLSPSMSVLLFTLLHNSTPTTHSVQRVQLSSKETVQWHKLWQFRDTNLPRYIYIYI